MEFVEEKRTRSVVLCVALTALGLWSLLPVFGWHAGRDFSTALWAPLLWALFFGLAFFSFQSIFYRRTVRFLPRELEVRVDRWRSPVSVRRVPYEALKGLRVQLHFSRIPFLGGRLQLTTLSDDENWNGDVYTQSRGQSQDAFLSKAREIESVSGLRILDDESGLVGH